MSSITSQSPGPISRDRSTHDNVDYFSLRPDQKRESEEEHGQMDSDIEGKVNTPNASVKTKNPPAIKRPSYNERTPSSSSIRRSQLISSPKTPNRSLFPFPQQSQKPPNTAQSNFVTTPPAFKNFRHGATDKKLLVEQFYSSVNEPKSRANVKADQQQIQLQQQQQQQKQQQQAKDELIDELTSKEYEVSKKKELKFKNASFDDSFTQGELVYLPLDNHIIRNDNLTNYLLNIDLVTNEILHQKNQDAHSHYNIRGIDTSEENENNLQPLLNILDNVTTTLKSDLHQEISKKNGKIEVPPSIVQLEKLSSRLTDIHSSITEVFDNLYQQREDIKGKYRDKINQNVNKLLELVISLESLETRLSDAKNEIKQNKQIMSSELIEKFETLEYIDKKFDNHTKLTRNRRFKQLNISLAVLVVLFSIYMGLIR